MQSGVLVGAAPYALPLTCQLMPEFLNQLGYQSQFVGKWHLGSYKADYTPTKRGFKSHVGYWTGHIDYYDHTAEELYYPVVRFYLYCSMNFSNGCLKYGKLLIAMLCLGGFIVCYN